MPVPLTPGQTVEDAAALGATAARALHREPLDNPLAHVEQPDVPERFGRAAPAVY
ncbi:hypothetical protein [Streptomyces sp. NPDC005009]